ncbi:MULTISPECIES: cytochrome P450 [Bacillus]|uniref:cytochrome P450 n=1 Tax=Bacillus TaxID=1386 RepID=UPI000B43C466|nr:MULTISPECIES: cytochrome P450 [Bacillus]MCQ9148515.1 cytochrome P450 [Bacillus amyloliquefaciens]NRS32548.1 cytochrome P450 [Bacillus velezensis]NRS43586.1 cytochrome P450 [Bacillus velezensis]QVL91842.1 cytochrome P450 [Bacillus velezensis]UJX20014.1 cytochrome P450 [Bacillus sp. R45]
MTAGLSTAHPSLHADSDFWNDPYPFYEKLRAIDPVYKGTVLKHPGWYVTGYKEAAAILKDTRFKNRVPFPEASTKYQNLSHIQHDMLLFKNQSDHKRMRMLIGKEFTAKTAESLRPCIKETVHDLLDQIQNKKNADLVSEFAFPLASLIIAEILGVPKEERYQFRQWTADVIQAIDLTRSRKMLVRASDTAGRLTAYFRDLIHERKAHPQEDLISRFIMREQLSKDEVLATCILLVIAGHETTVNLMSNGVFTLLKHPEQLSALRENPSLIETAVEECLRYDSPAQLTARTASEDCEINGKIIKKGEQVYILLGAANRDPSIFDQPHKMDIQRKPNPHLAFGKNAHFCIGSLLARIEAQIAILTLFERMPKLRLAAHRLEYRKLIGFRSLKELPVVLG